MTELISGTNASLVSSLSAAAPTLGTDGDPFSVMSTGLVTGSNSWATAYWDLGAYRQIDSVQVLARASYEACRTLWNRDAGTDVVVGDTLDPVLFAGGTAPGAAVCGSLPKPLAAPHSWYGVECAAAGGVSRHARYVMLRVVPKSNAVCGVPPPSDWTQGCAINDASQAFMNPAEVAVYASRCPSLRAIASNTSAFTDGAGDGCGPAPSADAPDSSATLAAWSGSTCTHSCADATMRRVRGGAANASALQALRCDAGVWVDNSTAIDPFPNLGATPPVCGLTCPSVLMPSPFVDLQRCAHTVAVMKFSAGAGALADWYPAFTLMHVGGHVNSSLAARLPAMEHRAIVDGGVLTLSGRETLWALNNPLWASTPQTGDASWQSVSATVWAAAGAQAGLALRVSQGSAAAPGVSMYLLRLTPGSLFPTVSRFVDGVETVLGTAPIELTDCALNASPSDGGGVVLTFLVQGAALTVQCGASSMTVYDSAATPLCTGSAGLYQLAGNATGAGRAYFDDLTVQRSCDASGACPEALAGEACTAQCAGSDTQYSMICGPSGRWVLPAQECSNSGALAVPT